ncbi:hypothetical protein RhiJN_01604 [Ceratobasidium sp. AG-Ba]|nr:hypothetical protein RhiJN_01584 [Ceratobasidium sp. AG-Ba]QRV73590.1 hypothetical protein RhiJN_01604 [Ceratobasidium sp. AG-Ba]
MVPAWIERVVEGLRTGMCIRHAHGINDHDQIEYCHHDGLVAFSDILHDTRWINEVGRSEYGRAYVINLDYRAFTVIRHTQWKMNFRLDNMPPSNPGVSHYVESWGDSVPEECLMSTLYWPNPTFDPETISGEYSSYNAIIGGPRDWGMPDWESMSFSQRLSFILAKKTVQDCRLALNAPDIESNYGRIVQACWRIACAAAPGLLSCPIVLNPLSLDPLYGYANLPRRKEISHNHFLYRGHTAVYPPPRPYYRFRGCLIKFCLRLDQENYVQHEILGLVTRLRQNSRARGIGIAMSSDSIVAVAVDGERVCRSPVSRFYHRASGTYEEDGLMLLLHLLSPYGTTRKTPWTNTPDFVKPVSTRYTLSREILEHILFFLDEETYQFTLPLVSQEIRLLSFLRPRLLTFVVIGVNSDGRFKLLSTSDSRFQVFAELRKMFSNPIYQLMRAFQYRRANTMRDSDSATEITAVEWAEEHTIPCEGSSQNFIPLEYIMSSDEAPAMMLQILPGEWEFRFL